MNRTFAFAALLAALPLAACGGAETPSEKLEEAAEQSDPAAAAVLENAADRIEDMNAVQPVGEPGSAAQQAMQEAGDAQARTVQQPGQAGTELDASVTGAGAKPHQAGDPVPPPQVEPEGR